ncbi:MAG: LuxR C-terminal-related transcriptional regulator [Candidatus Longimicrobiales bacterium M2_2A_002]
MSRDRTGPEAPDTADHAVAPEPGVIAAKVRVPTPRLDVVTRPRLLDRLDDDRHRVVLVSAPAGSGKTVLVLDWLRSSDRPVAWLSLDPLDNDPTRFFTHLAAALRRAGIDAFDRAAELVDAASPTGRGVGSELTAALARAPDAVLVLDDLHQVEAPILLDLLRELIAGAGGAGPRLVLLTRVDPALRLGRIRLSGELLELRQRDLRFTGDEAAELFSQLLPGGLDAELVARLEERTEGWAAGLRMAAAALDRVDDPAAAVDAFTGSHELMVDYLLEEALGRQDEAMQRFLMETSILPRFTAATCRAVTGDDDAADRLAAIDDANLFLVSLDDRREWYRYHHLFAELLEFRLRQRMPDRADPLHERASRWFEEHDDVQEALRQAAAMDDDTRLLELLDRHGYPILARSEFASFARWLDHVADPLSRPWPMFLVAVAWFRFQTQRGPDLDALLGSIEAALEAAPDDYPESQRREARMHLGALRAFALRIADRLEEAVEAGEEALDALPPGPSVVRGILEFNMGAVHLRLANTARARAYLEQGFDRSLEGGASYLVLASLAHLGYLASLTEGVAAARQRLESAVEFARERKLDALPAFGIVLYQLAQLHWLADELDEARTILERAEALTRDERETDILANVLIHRARVETAAGSFDTAEDHLTRATALAHGNNVKPFATSLAVERARLVEARSGRLQTPESAPPSVEPPGRWSSVREAEAVLQLQHLVKLGRPEDAAPLAARLREESEARDRGPALCVARLAEAALAEDAAARHEALEAGLALAARNGYVRPVLNGGEPVRAMIEAGLKATSLDTAVRAFAKDVLRRFPTPERAATPAGAAARSPDGPPPVAGAEGAGDATLTDRELETLALLTRGLTNKAMAKELYVSVNTVKTHLKRIYAKLDVSTRTEAARRARTLGIVPGDEG